MSKELIVSSTTLETKVAILEDNQVQEIFIERSKNRGILGNICKGRVTKVLPGMQAAFVDIGLERHAFLYVSDFFEEYEEYEVLLSQEERKAKKPLSQKGHPHHITISSDDSRRTNRGKSSNRAQKNLRQRPSKESRSMGTTAAGGTKKDASQKRGKEPTAEKTSSSGGVLTESMYHATVLSESGSILPENLNLWDSLDPAMAKESELESREYDSRPAGQDILPDWMGTVAKFEPKLPSRENKSAKEGARLQTKSDLDQFSLSSTNARTDSKRKSNNNRRENVRGLIGDLLSEGQEILVQVAKEPIGKKGSRITSHVALPGHYLVYMPTVDHVGVSRKIVPEKERQRLKDTVLKLRGDFGKGFIVRTAGENHYEDDFRQDMIYLTRLWEDIRVKAEQVSAPALVHKEPNLVHRLIRDYFSKDFRAIRVDDEQEYEHIVDFVSKFSPELVNRVRLFSKKTPIFDQFGINTEIEKALKQKVWLKNGGCIVINQTEALVAIDVNTGKFIGRTDSLEDTITKTNLSAVKEVVRQIRLRDLGGIIVIDFIDMDEPRNRQKVIEALQQELGKSKSPTKILPFNQFGLVAITRKRVRQSLERTLCQPCTFCNGIGMTRSVQTICYSIHQEILRILPTLGEGREILIRCHPDVGKALQDSERQILAEIEETTAAIVSIKNDPLMHVEQFDITET